jgi:aspartate kinase
MHAGSSKSLVERVSASLRSRSRVTSSRQSPSFPTCHDPLSTLPGRNYIDDHKVAIVCSARSGSTKALGTTNLLLRASSEALQKPAAGTLSTAGYVTPGTSRTSRSHDWTSPLHSPDRSRSPSHSVLPSGGLSSSLMMSSSLMTTSTPPPSDEPPFFATVDLIRSEHMMAARSLITSLTILRELEEEIDKDCDALRSFLMAIQVGICSRSGNSFVHPLPRSSVRCHQDQKTQ